MTNIVENWIAAATCCGESLTVALNHLNEDLGANYGLSRMGEWRNGKRALPDHVHRYMLAYSLHKILREHGFDGPDISDDAAYERLANSLMPPKR